MLIGNGLLKGARPLKEDFRYTSNTVFDSFPWPQSPTKVQVKQVAEISTALREFRRSHMDARNLSLRGLYRTLELPGRNPLRDVHEELDAAVRDAYGMKKMDDPLTISFCS